MTWSCQPTSGNCATNGTPSDTERFYDSQPWVRLRASLGLLERHVRRGLAERSGETAESPAPAGAWSWRSMRAMVVRLIPASAPLPSAHTHRTTRGRSGRWHGGLLSMAAITATWV
jgi:hypothetical protein